MLQVWIMHPQPGFFLGGGGKGPFFSGEASWGERSAGFYPAALRFFLSSGWNRASTSRLISWTAGTQSQPAALLAPQDWVPTSQLSPIQPKLGGDDCWVGSPPVASSHSSPKLSSLGQITQSYPAALPLTPMAMGPCSCQLISWLVGSCCQQNLGWEDCWWLAGGSLPFPQQCLTCWGKERG